MRLMQLKQNIRNLKKQKYIMTIEEIDKIINDLRQQIPNMQMQLNQAEGYKQALVDMDKKEEGTANNAVSQIPNKSKDT